MLGNEIVGLKISINIPATKSVLKFNGLLTTNLECPAWCYYTIGAPKIAMIPQLRTVEVDQTL